MFGRTGLSGMSREIQMDRLTQLSSSTGLGCVVTQIMQNDLAELLYKVLIMHCEKPVRETDATCLISTCLTALY